MPTERKLLILEIAKNVKMTNELIFLILEIILNVKIPIDHKFIGIYFKHQKFVI